MYLDSFLACEMCLIREATDSAGVQYQIKAFLYKGINFEKGMCLFQRTEMLFSSKINIYFSFSFYHNTPSLYLFNSYCELPFDYIKYMPVFCRKARPAT